MLYNIIFIWFLIKQEKNDLKVFSENRHALQKFHIFIQ